jgi:glutaminase
MEELGYDKVFQRIGSEPTGRAFNSVTAVVEMPTHTANPLVNAGAIATTSLIFGKDANEKWNKILDFYSKVAGEKLVLIDEVYKSATKRSPCSWPSTNASMPIRLNRWTFIQSSALWA